MTQSHVRQELLSAVEPILPTLERWVDGFVLAKKAEGLSHGTIHIVYAPRLRHFIAYCAGRNIHHVEHVDATLLREYLLQLAENHNPGGCHQYYRVLKTFLRWFEIEGAGDGWRNPIKRVVHLNGVIRATRYLPQFYSIHGVFPAAAPPVSRPGGRRRALHGRSLDKSYHPG